MKKFGWLLLITMSVAVLLAGCGRSITTYTDPGQQINVKVSQEFVIALGANPTTGYGWQVKPDAAMVTLVSKEYEPGESSKQGMVGAGGVEVFRFKALQKGQTIITLDYQRPWETQSIEQKTFTIDIK